MQRRNIDHKVQSKSSVGKRSLIRIAVLSLLGGAGFLIVTKHQQKMYAKHHVKAVSDALREEPQQIELSEGVQVSFRAKSECFPGDLDIMAWANQVGGNENLLFAIERLDASENYPVIYSRAVSLQSLKQGLDVRLERKDLPSSGLLGVFVCSDSRSKENRCFGKDMANMNKLSQLYGAAHPLAGAPMEDALKKARLNKDQIFYFNRIVLGGDRAVLKTAKLSASETEILKAATLKKDDGLSKATAISYREYLDAGAKMSSSLPLESESADKGQVAIVLPYYDKNRCDQLIRQMQQSLPQNLLGAPNNP